MLLFLCGNCLLCLFNNILSSEAKDTKQVICRARHTKGVLNTDLDNGNSIVNGTNDKTNIWNVNTEKEYHEEKK